MAQKRLSRELRKVSSSRERLSSLSFKDEGRLDPGRDSGLGAQQTVWREMAGREGTGAHLHRASHDSAFAISREGSQNRRPFGD